MAAQATRERTLISPRLVGAAALASMVALWCGVAAAQETWDSPHPGVQHMFKIAGGPLRIHGLVIDLCAPGTGVRATTPGEKKQKTSKWAASVGVQAAINADFYNGSYDPIGLAMGNGEVWGSGVDTTWQALVAFGKGHAAFSPEAEVFSPAWWTRDVVSGFAQIMKDGQAITSYDCSGHFCQKHPRTAVGLSHDRRTLYMLVVDGRTDLSVGVTLKELAGIMKDLGAVDAVNLDGGGSTTMWVAGPGIVNHPSDDAGERTVANHLGAFATGSGQPGVCNEWPPEQVQVDAGLFDAAGSTDVDGDGLGDLCARGAAGLYCHLSGDGKLVPVVEGPGPELSNDLGWNAPSHYGTIHMGDVNADALADVCARGNAGMRCWLSNGTGFSTDTITGPEWSDAAGWEQEKHYSTIRMLDVDGDGMADLCGRGPDGIRCHLSTGTGFDAGFAGPELSDPSGWGAPQYYGTIRSGDFNGDGKHDLCARAAKGVLCWPSTGTGFGPVLDGPAWSDESGAAEMRYWQTLRMADINGDAKDDLCMRDDAGILCFLSNGAGFPDAVPGPDLSDGNGWHDQTNYLPLRWGDINGDARADVCARADKEMACWLSQGDSFGSMIDGPMFSDDQQWFMARYYNTVRLADVDGDGLADICGRGKDGVVCFLSDGNGFPTQWSGPGWSDASGWGSIEYWSSLRLQTPAHVNACLYPWACVPDAVETAACGQCGESVRSCLASCEWTDWSPCGAAASQPTDGGPCFDGNPCTADSCGAAGDCQHTFTNDLCDDGDPCTVNACQDGSCIMTDKVAGCCASHEECGVPLERCDAEGHVCLPVLCSPCTAHDDCGVGGNLCVAMADGTSACGVQCEVGACPEGSVCTDFGDLPAQCLPADLVCDSIPARGDDGVEGVDGDVVGTGDAAGSDTAAGQGDAGSGGGGGSSGGCAVGPRTASGPGALLAVAAALIGLLIARKRLWVAPAVALGVLSCGNVVEYVGEDSRTLLAEGTYQDSQPGLPPDAGDTPGSTPDAVPGDGTGLPPNGGDCVVQNAFGKCPGKLSTGPDGTLICVGPVPSAETCNGLDDDCDGTKDEDGCNFCGMPDTCKAGEVEQQTEACDPCSARSRSRTCDGMCQWGPWSEWSACAAGGGECTAGAVDAASEPCGNCGMRSRERTCGPSCTWEEWGEWGACGNQGPCAVGATESQQEGCGNCGQRSRSRTCIEGCVWGDWGGWGDCAGQGPCAPGSTQGGGCDPCSQQVCQGNCQWGGCGLSPGSECEWQEGKHWKCCASGKWHFCLGPAYGCKWSGACSPCTGCGC